MHIDNFVFCDIMKYKVFINWRVEMNNKQEEESRKEVERIFYSGEAQKLFDEAYKKAAYQKALAKRKPELEALESERQKKYSVYRKKVERTVMTPQTSEVAPKSFVLGLISAIGTMTASKFIRDGGIRNIDKDRAYFASHPEALEKAKEVLGTDNLDYIAGYVRGSDGLAQALFVDCGLKDYYYNNGVQAVIDGTITGLLAFAVPTLLYFGLNTIRYKREQKALKAVDDVNNKIEAVENEARLEANKIVEEMKNKKAQESAEKVENVPILTL